MGPGLGKTILAAMLLAPWTAGEAARPHVRYRPSLLVQLQVSDLERSIRFYTETLGFEVTERRDDLRFVHLGCGLPGLQIGLSAGGTAPPQAGTVVLNFGVQGDIEDARRALESRGVVFLGPTVVIPGKVRLAEFRDPDGYRIRLAGRTVEEEHHRAALTDDDDSAAIRAYLAHRDEDGFLVLYRRHTPYLFRLALRLLGGRRGQAEDAVQETWLRAAARLADFRGDAALRTWLAGFAINCCREILRKDAPAHDAMIELAVPPAPLHIDLERAITALPNGYREVLVLHDLEGYSHEEIAARLEISTGTSKSQLSRARRALRGRIA